MEQPNVIVMSAMMFWTLCVAWGSSIAASFALGVAFWHKYSAQAGEDQSAQSALRNAPTVKRAKRRIRDA